MNPRRTNIVRMLVLAAAVCLAAALAAVAVASGGTTLKTGQAKQGRIIVTSGERAVYMFTRDSRSKSNCSGKCPAAWPPVTGSATVAKGSGLDPKLLGTIRRGSQAQVTYNHHPLYLFAKDSPHKIKGEGANAFGGHWYLLGPRGGAVKPKTYCKTVCQGY